MTVPSNCCRGIFAAVAALLLLAACGRASADGYVKAPAQYAGSLEEKSQEAIIIFDRPEDSEVGNEDLILKISVEGGVDRFAWVIPFPNPPMVREADGLMFKELFDYVAYMTGPIETGKGKKFGGGFGGGGSGRDVDVLSRELVGAFDVAVVKENESGSLNRWLDQEGFQPIEDGEPIVEEYRRRNFVFACIKVSDAPSGDKDTKDLHPLRFTFDTGGHDGIYFPMKLTGLQATPFDVNLYVFSRRTLNANRNIYGYEQRGFRQKYQSREPLTGNDVAVSPRPGRFFAEANPESVFKSFMSNCHPRQAFYLTNIQATRLDPADVRGWRNDLWLFPDYGRRFQPYDARRRGPAYSE